MEEERMFAEVLVRCSWVRLALLAALAAGCSEPAQTPVDPSTSKSLDAAATAGTESDPEELALRRTLTGEALADLHRAGAFLGAQPHFSFRADLSYDVMQPDGQLLEFGGVRRVVVRRPDRMRFEVTDRSGATKTLTFDGATVSIDLPDHDAYVSIERPGSLYAAIDHLVDDLGVPAPLEDLIGENFAAKVRPRIESGYFVGTDAFGERRCDHLAYRLPDADVQLWIEQGERALPCRLSVTYLHEPGQPQFRAQLSSWDLEPDVSDARFAFEPPAGAQRIPVRKVVRAGEED
jgi:hypothetical protein